MVCMNHVLATLIVLQTNSKLLLIFISIALIVYLLSNLQVFVPPIFKFLLIDLKDTSTKEPFDVYPMYESF